MGAAVECEASRLGAENRQLPTSEEALRRVKPASGQLALDVGCGAGACLGVLAARGVRAYGIDA
jgi:2-polyprenyl-3-methyl-5-hydroxy-6-metoxy-1,4-benzoquinol methylase